MANSSKLSDNAKRRALLEKRIDRLSKMLKNESYDPAEDMIDMLTKAKDFAREQSDAADDPDIAHDWNYIFNELDGLIMLASRLVDEDEWDADESYKRARCESKRFGGLRRRFHK